MGTTILPVDRNVPIVGPVQEVHTSTISHPQLGTIPWPQQRNSSLAGPDQNVHASIGPFPQQGIVLLPVQRNVPLAGPDREVYITHCSPSTAGNHPGPAPLNVPSHI